MCFTDSVICSYPTSNLGLRKANLFDKWRSCLQAKCSYYQSGNSNKATNGALCSTNVSHHATKPRATDRKERKVFSNAAASVSQHAKWISSASQTQNQHFSSDQSRSNNANSCSEWTPNVQQQKCCNAKTVSVKKVTKFFNSIQTA